jgi:PTS system nitrogen regulatory IIA component
MHLAAVIKPALFWPDLLATSKAEVIRELASKIASSEKGLSAAQIEEILMERERLGSTGIQDGIAIPHGKVPGLEHVIVACGHSQKGIDFDSHDQRPTRLFFVLLAPEFAAGQHLKVLARLSRLLKSEEFREKLMSSTDADEMYRAIIDEDEKN